VLEAVDGVTVGVGVGVTLDVTDGVTVGVGVGVSLDVTDGVIDGVGLVAGLVVIADNGPLTLPTKATTLSLAEPLDINIFLSAILWSPETN
jgi:hypothetical protein